MPPLAYENAGGNKKPRAYSPSFSSADLYNAGGQGTPLEQAMRKSRDTPLQRSIDQGKSPFERQLERDRQFPRSSPQTPQYSAPIGPGLNQQGQSTLPKYPETNVIDELMKLGPSISVDTSDVDREALGYGPGATQGTGYAFTPFSYGDFNYKGPSVDDIMSQLWGAMGEGFGSQRSNLDTRKAEALAAIEQAYMGTGKALRKSQKVTDERYEDQLAEAAAAGEAAQENIGQGMDDAASRQETLARNLGIEEAMVNNPQAEADQAFYSSRAADNSAAESGNINDAQTRGFKANENAITTAALASPQMQNLARNNYDSALAELDSLENQARANAYMAAMQQYNQNRGQSLSEWQTGLDTAYKNWAAEQSWLQGQAQSDQERQLEQMRLDNEAAIAAYEAENQPVDLGDYATAEDELHYNLTQAGVSPQKATEWYNRLHQRYNDLGQLEQSELTPQQIAEWFAGSSRAESYLQDYARKFGYLG